MAIFGGFAQCHGRFYDEVITRPMCFEAESLVQANLEALDVILVQYPREKGYHSHITQFSEIVPSRPREKTTLEMIDDLDKYMKSAFDCDLIAILKRLEKEIRDIEVM